MQPFTIIVLCILSPSLVALGRQSFCSPSPLAPAVLHQRLSATLRHRPQQPFTIVLCSPPPSSLVALLHRPLQPFNVLLCSPLTSLSSAALHRRPQQPFINVCLQPFTIVLRSSSSSPSAASPSSSAAPLHHPLQPLTSAHHHHLLQPPTILCSDLPSTSAALRQRPLLPSSIVIRSPSPRYSAALLYRQLLPSTIALRLFFTVTLHHRPLQSFTNGCLQPFTIVICGTSFWCCVMSLQPRFPMCVAMRYPSYCTLLFLLKLYMPVKSNIRPG